MKRQLVQVACAAVVVVLIVGAFAGRLWINGVFLVVAVAAVNAAPRNGRLRLMSAAAAPWLMAVAGAALVLQFIRVLIEGDFGRSQGFLTHPNIAAASVLALWTLFIVGGTAGKEARSFGGKARRVLLVFGTLVSTFLLLAAGSRSLLIGVALGVVVSAVVARGRSLRKRDWVWAALGLAAVVVGLVAVTFLRGDVDSLLGSFERGPIFMTALGIARLSPITGLGDGAWVQWAPIIEPSLPLAAAAHPHSVLLDALIAGGSVGLAALLLVYALGVHEVVTRVRKRSSYGGLALLMTMTALSAQALVDLAVLAPSVYIPLVLAIACWGIPEAGSEVGGGA